MKTLAAFAAAPGIAAVSRLPWRRRTAHTAPVGTKTIRAAFPRHLMRPFRRLYLENNKR